MASSLMRLKALLGLVIVCSGLTCVSELRAVASEEYRIKAVFLYNFTQFVQWPAGAFQRPDSPLIIGVLGTDPFGQHLDEIVRDETVRGRKLVIQRYSRLEQLGGCHLIFVSQSQEKQLESILDYLKGTSILTVSDMGEFVSRGGMIGLVTRENKIRMQINVQASKAARLELSSKLLAAAEKD